MHIFSRDELAGVIGHELAHIKNRNILIGTIAATCGWIAASWTRSSKNHLPSPLKDAEIMTMMTIATKAGNMMTTVIITKAADANPFLARFLILIEVRYLNSLLSGGLQRLLQATGWSQEVYWKRRFMFWMEKYNVSL